MLPLRTLLAVSLVAICSCHAQSTYHSDAFRNSFTVKVPGSQQTFTRFFGGQPGAVQQQQQGVQAQHQPQYQYPQQPQTEQFTNYQQGPDQLQYQSANQQHYQAQRELIQLQQQQQQQIELQQQQQQQQEPQQPISSQDLAAYFQQVQRAQQQQNLQQQYHQSPVPFDNRSQQSQPQQQQQQPPQSLDATSPSTTQHLLGVAYSPSNQVSQVKFTSTGLNYNF